MSPPPRAVAAGAFTELVYHGLAHLPSRDASSCFAPAYLAWAHAAFAPAAWASLARDGALLGARYEAAGGPARVLHALPRLHRSLGEFRRRGAQRIAEFTQEDSAEPALAEALATLDPVLTEVLRADLLLAAPSFAVEHAARIAPALGRAAVACAPWFARATALDPSLGRARVELCLALGPRGRLLAPGWIVVGAPAVWNALAPADAALQALHERAVARAARTERDERRTEWTALLDVAARVARDRALAAAHVRWVARLALAPLVELARAHGAIDALAAARVLDPSTRAGALRTAATLLRRP